MKKGIKIAIVSSVVSIGLLVVVYLNKSSDTTQLKTVFMDSYMVFEEFEMKKDYDKRLEKEIVNEQAELDAIGAQLNSSSDQLKIAALKKEFTVKKLAFDKKFNAISQQYTNEVYKRLNGYIKSYGKKNHFGVIIGSNGQGNVMYVDEKQDVTKDLIQYINLQYTK